MFACPNRKTTALSFLESTELLQPCYNIVSLINQQTEPVEDAVLSQKAVLTANYDISYTMFQLFTNRKPSLSSWKKTGWSCWIQWFYRSTSEKALIPAKYGLNAREIKSDHSRCYLTYIANTLKVPRINVICVLLSKHYVCSNVSAFTYQGPKQTQQSRTGSGKLANVTSYR